jgi:hypothetical protein
VQEPTVWEGVLLKVCVLLSDVMRYSHWRDFLQGRKLSPWHLQSERLTINDGGLRVDDNNDCAMTVE